MKLFTNTRKEQNPEASSIVSGGYIETGIFQADHVEPATELTQIVGALNRIADTLEKQNAGQFIPEDSNGPYLSGSGANDGRVEDLSKKIAAVIGENNDDITVNNVIDGQIIGSNSFHRSLIDSGRITAENYTL